MTGPIALATIRTSFVLGLRLLVQAGSLLLVARLLGPMQFGAFAAVTALAVLLGTLCTFGTHLVLLGEMSKAPERRGQVLCYALPTTLLGGAVLLAAYALIYELVLHGNGVGWNVLLTIGVAEMLLQPLAALAVVEALASERTARSQLLQTLPLALRLVAVLVVLVMQPSDPMASYGYGYCIATAIALVVVVGGMPRPWPHPRRWRWPDWQELRESASYAVLNITAIGPAELDKILAAKLLPLPMAGLYATGARVVSAAVLPVLALMLSALPRLYREGSNRPRRSAHLLRWILLSTTLYSVALAAMLWWGAPLFVWLLGDKYKGVDFAIRWLCIAVPGMALRIATGNVLMALGKPWMRAAFEIVGLVVLAVVASTLTRHLGLNGMALALACSEWGMAILGSWLIAQSQKKNVDKKAADSDWKFR